MARNRGPQPLGDVLKSVIDRMGLRPGLDKARVIETWAMIAGPQVNGLTQTAWVNGARLYVKVTSPAWRQELHMRRRAWRDRLNGELGQDLIDEIVFR